MDWLRPDAKAQVTVQYDHGVPVGIDTVVLSHQHDASVSRQDLIEGLKTEVIETVLGPTGLLSPKTRYFINPTGRFVTGGPAGDTGLTGRKIIVDTYGGMGRHGGAPSAARTPQSRPVGPIWRAMAKTWWRGVCTVVKIRLLCNPISPTGLILVDTFDLFARRRELERCGQGIRLVAGRNHQEPRPVAAHRSGQRDYGLWQTGKPWEAIRQRRLT